MGQFYEQTLMKGLLLRLIAGINFISLDIPFDRVRPTDRDSFARIFSLADCYTNLSGK